MPRARIEREGQLGNETVALLEIVQQIVEDPGISDRMKVIATGPLLMDAADRTLMDQELHSPAERQRRTLADHRQRLGGERFVDEFRFYYTHIPKLLDLLQIPESVQLPGRRGQLPGADVLGITLHMLAQPRTHVSEADYWGLWEPDIGEAYNWCINHIYDRLGHLILELQVEAIKPKLPTFASAVEDKGSPLAHVWAFTDGTIRKISRPSVGQRMFFNGKDRVHAIKFQAVTTPDGIIRHLTDAFAGTVHDAKIMQESDLDRVLRAHMVVNGTIYTVYGDPAYRRTPFLFTPFKGNILPGSWEAWFNARMASVRISAEWGFGLLTSLWRAENFPPGHKLFLSKCGLGPQYTVMAILTNLHTCLYGCQTSKYFNVYPPSLEAYVAGTA